MNFWHHLELTQYERDEGYLSRPGVDGCTWKNFSLDLLPESVEEWVLMTPLIERVEPNSVAAAGDRLLVHFSSSKITARAGDTQTATTSA